MLFPLVALCMSSPGYVVGAFQFVPAEFARPEPEVVQVPGLARGNALVGEYDCSDKLIHLSMTVRSFEGASARRAFQQKNFDSATEVRPGPRHATAGGIGTTPSGYPIGEYQMCSGGSSNAGEPMRIHAGVKSALVEVMLSPLVRRENGVRRIASKSWPEDCLASETLARRALSYLLCERMPSSAALASTKTFELSGVTFESVVDWAKAHGFAHRYDHDAEIVVLDNGKKRIVVPLATNKVLANGKSYDLSSCTIKVGGKFWLPIKELSRTVAD